MPPAPSEEEPTAERRIIPAPLLEIFAKLKAANPALFKPFEVLTAIDMSKRANPTPINLNPPKALKVLATRDRPKPKQDLLAISKRRNTIKAANLKPKASIFAKPKSFSEKSRFTRPPAEPTTPPDDKGGNEEGGTE
jgi:hypothetical protein